MHKFHLALLTNLLLMAGFARIALSQPSQFRFSWSASEARVAWRLPWRQIYRFRILCALVAPDASLQFGQDPRR
jgi:hypothetical protein